MQLASPPLTYLFVPGDRPDRFGKAASCGADRIIRDIEDAVKPPAKPDARAAILAAELDWSRVVVRINDAASPFFEEDLSWLAGLRAATVMIPKSETAQTLDRVAKAAGREMELLPLVETVRGYAGHEREALESVVDMLKHPLVRRAAFGHVDFSLDLGAEPHWDALLYSRSRLVSLSRLAGAEPPVDSVTVQIGDDAIVSSEARAARRLGFGGKLLIHPSQVGPVRDAFLPSPGERDWARRVLDAIARAGSGAVAVDGKMIDKPVEEAARRILARACEAHP